MTNGVIDALNAGFESALDAVLPPRKKRTDKSETHRRFSLLPTSHELLGARVTTTGATLINAGKPLEKAGAEVTLFARA